MWDISLGQKGGAALCEKGCVCVSVCVSLEGFLRVMIRGCARREEV